MDVFFPLMLISSDDLFTLPKLMLTLILLMVCTMLKLFMFLVTCTDVPGGGEGDHPLQPVDPPHGLHHAPAIHVPGYLY